MRKKKSNIVFRIVRHYLLCFYRLFVPTIKDKIVYKRIPRWKIKFKRFKKKIWNKIINYIFIRK